MRNSREPRIGDRFRWKIKGDVWEYTHTDIDGCHWSVCIDPGKESVTNGNVYTWDFNENFWKYLGNFSKGNNFQSLYEKLSS